MSVQTWEAYELTGDFQGKRHSFHRSRSMAKRVLSHHALELFEVRGVRAARASSRQEWAATRQCLVRLQLGHTVHGFAAPGLHRTSQSTARLFVPGCTWVPETVQYHTHRISNVSRVVTTVFAVLAATETSAIVAASASQTRI
jgi:hypothetical protein